MRVLDTKHSEETEPVIKHRSFDPATRTLKKHTNAHGEDVEMEDEDAKVKKEAEAEKAKGNAAYRARDFGTAAGHFQKAWDLWPKDLTFLTNLGGT